MSKGDFRKELRERENYVHSSIKKNYPVANRPIKRGDIYFFEKGYTVGVEQQGGRPGIVVSNNACNDSSDFLLVIYLTCQEKQALPTHVPILSCDRPSTALCEQIHTLSKLKLSNYNGSVSEKEMEEINQALLTTLGFDLANITKDEYSEMLQDLQDLRNKNEYLTSQVDVLTEKNNDLHESLKLAEKKDSTSTDVKAQNKIESERDLYKSLYEDLLDRYLK